MLRLPPDSTVVPDEGAAERLRMREHERACRDRGHAGVGIVGAVQRTAGRLPLLMRPVAAADHAADAWRSADDADDDAEA